MAVFDSYQLSNEAELDLEEIFVINASYRACLFSILKVKKKQ